MKTIQDVAAELGCEDYRIDEVLSQIDLGCGENEYQLDIDYVSEMVGETREILLTDEGYERILMDPLLANFMTNKTIPLLRTAETITADIIQNARNKEVMRSLIHELYRSFGESYSPYVLLYPTIPDETATDNPYPHKLEEVATLFGVSTKWLVNYCCPYVDYGYQDSDIFVVTKALDTHRKDGITFLLEVHISYEFFKTIVSVINKRIHSLYKEGKYTQKENSLEFVLGQQAILIGFTTFNS